MQTGEGCRRRAPVHVGRGSGGLQWATMARMRHEGADAPDAVLYAWPPEGVPRRTGRRRLDDRHDFARRQVRRHHREHPGTRPGHRRAVRRAGRGRHRRHRAERGARRGGRPRPGERRMPGRLRAGRRGRRRLLPPGHRGRRRGLRRPPRPRQRRGADRAGHDLGHRSGALRPDDGGQRARPLLPHAGRGQADGARGRGRLDRERLERRLPRQRAVPVPLRGLQGRAQRVDEERRLLGRAPPHPGQRDQPRLDGLRRRGRDPAALPQWGPGLAPRRRSEDAVRAPAEARRGGADHRLPRLGRVQG